MKNYKNLLAILLVISIFSLIPVASTKAINIKDLLSSISLIQSQLNALSKEVSSYFSQQASVSQGFEEINESELDISESSTEEPVENQEKTIENDIQEIKITIDYAEISRVQALINSGYQSWRMIPQMVLKNQGVDYGYLEQELQNAKQISYFPNIGVVKYSVIHEHKVWTITLIQPTVGEGNIWTISEIKLTDDLKSPPCENYGDLNGDGFIAQDDLDILLDYIYQNGEITKEQLNNADINKDEKVDLFDSIYLKKYLDEKITEFPACFANFSIILPDKKDVLENTENYEIKWTMPLGVEAYLVDFYLINKKGEKLIDEIYVPPFARYDDNNVIENGYNWKVNESQRSDYRIKLEVRDLNDNVIISKETKETFRIKSIIGYKKLSPCENYGDLNFNGYIDSIDSLIIRNYFNRIGSLSDEQRAIVDLNNNQRVDYGDANVIDFYLEGRISSFLVCASDEINKLDLSVKNVYIENSKIVIEINNLSDIEINENSIITGWIYKDGEFFKEFSINESDFYGRTAIAKEGISNFNSKILVLLDPLNSLDEETKNNNYFIFEK